ncbi:hypothetical protein GA0070216_102247 [Micromonospora matsumotoense]|uniref:Uncharacterized protein n=1 Tax=Micromonospora matsumotoense TaxID=121616 RepID=A0A1C4VAZ8_9ACTN|nr:hypothetical protein GA0070216_102247 [Micromonospora matsumotoense]
MAHRPGLLGLLRDGVEVNHDGAVDGAGTPGDDYRAGQDRGTSGSLST